jgi:hypothetical protein
VNRVEEANIPAGATIRIGVPAERPQAAIDALITFFSEMENVVSARLGLMEILHPDGNSEFTYTVGIQCSSDEQDTIRKAVEVLRTVPAGRWPISIFPPTNQYFTKEALVFFGRATESQGQALCTQVDLPSLRARAPAIPILEALPKSDPYGNEQFKQDLTSGRLRWLFLIMVLVNTVSLIDLALDSEKHILHFPVRLQGTVGVVVLSITLLAFSILAIVNWVFWFKKRHT